jgi:hypothetical protein
MARTHRVSLANSNSKKWMISKISCIKQEVLPHEIEGKYVSHMQWKNINDESGPVMYERRKF